MEKLQENLLKSLPHLDTRSGEQLMEGRGSKNIPFLRNGRSQCTSAKENAKAFIIIFIHEHRADNLSWLSPVIPTII